MELLKDPVKIRKAAWEKGIYVNIIPLKREKLSDVTLEVNIRGNIIKGKEVYSQKKPKALYEKVDEVYLWAYKNY